MFIISIKNTIFSIQLNNNKKENKTLLSLVCLVPGLLVFIFKRFLPVLSVILTHARVLRVEIGLTRASISDSPSEIGTNSFSNFFFLESSSRDSTCDEQFM
jgi:hypothetical protein